MIDGMQGGRACLGRQVGAEEGVGAAQDEVVDDGAQLTTALCALCHHLLWCVWLPAGHNGALDPASATLQQSESQVTKPCVQRSDEVPTS